MNNLGLRKKFCAPGGGPTKQEETAPKPPSQMDLFGQADAVVKHVLEVYFYNDLFPLSRVVFN